MGAVMRERVLVAGGALLALLLTSLGAFGQSDRKVAVAVLSPSTPERGLALNRPFVARMTELGWIEGRNITYHRAFAAGDTRRLDALAAELVARNPDLIFAGPTPSAVAAYKATRSIPIVFGVASDPVRLGMARSLGRPGGNVTGVISVSETLNPKRLQILTELIPKLKRVALLLHPADSASQSDRGPTEDAARTLRVDLIVTECRGPEDLERCIADAKKRGAEALLGSSSAMLFGSARRVIEIADTVRLPFAGGPAEFADAGALFGYSASLSAQFRRAAEYADRILRGAKAGELPIEQMREFELAINAKQVRAFGITVSTSIQLQANRVIE